MNLEKMQLFKEMAKAGQCAAWAERALHLSDLAETPLTSLNALNSQTYPGVVGPTGVEASIILFN